MKKEALIRKLENADLPQLLIVGHRERLRRVLLEGVYTGSESRNFSEAVSRRNIFNSLVDWLRAPAWRMAVASGLALFIVAAVLSLVFYLSAPSPSVIAADVVKNDPGIQQRLNGTGEIMIIRVDVRDGMASVVCGRCMGDFIEADVDMNVKAVVSARRYEGLFMPELAPESRERAINIAMSDPRLKSIMDKGGSVGRVYPIFSSVSNMSIIGGSIIKVTPVATQAIVPVQFDGKTWLAQVNIEQNRVDRIVEPEAGTAYYYEIFFRPQNL
jgi:hypothetical protein